MSHFSKAEKLAVDREQRSAIRSQQLLPARATGGKCLIPFRRHPPHGLSTGNVDARERGIGLVAAVEAVQESAFVNRRVPMEAELLCGPDVAMREVWPDLEERAAGPITGGDEHLVVEDDRTRRVHGLIGTAAPGK